MKRNLLNLIVLLILLSGQTVAIAQNVTPAFPTAEGHGMMAKGGRGGQVVEVTSLEDDVNGQTQGTLRWALNQHKNEPLTVVFRVSGIIRLVTDLRCKRTEGTTIAGQTAPGDGIVIRGAKMNFGGSKNLVIRHLRFRIGLNEDGSFTKGGSIGIENAENFIIDHCTFGWSGEENMTVYDNKKSTVQWCIVHEGLYASGHGKGARSYGAQWGGESATYHHNLLAHNVNRTPRFNGTKHNDVNVKFDYINNVNYNWGKPTSAYGAYIEIDGTYECNMINNYYKPGPAHPGNLPSFFVESLYTPSQGTTRIAKWYLKGNLIEGSANKQLNIDNSKGLDASAYTDKQISKSLLLSPHPFETGGMVRIEPAKMAFKSVLKSAGAFPRDEVDKRIVREVLTGTASGQGTTELYYDKGNTTPTKNQFFGVTKGIIDNPVLAFGSKAYPEYKTFNLITDADHDGMDDIWEVKNGLDPTKAADRNKITMSGYTFLEVYLNGLVGEKIEMK